MFFQSIVLTFIAMLVSDIIIGNRTPINPLFWIIVFFVFYFLLKENKKKKAKIESDSIDINKVSNRGNIHYTIPAVGSILSKEIEGYNCPYCKKSTDFKVIKRWTEDVEPVDENDDGIVWRVEVQCLECGNYKTISF